MKEIELIRSLFPEQLRFLWADEELAKYQFQEVRVRIRQPIIVQTQLGERFLDTRGKFILQPQNEMYKIQKEEFSQLVSYLCRESVYAYMEEMKRGYLTVRGGHRVGLAGEFYSIQKEEIIVRNIRSLNIRIAREIQGAANQIIPFLFENGNYQNTLIISPPGCGKTTLLRDLIRQLSNGTTYATGMKVGVVDERYELLGSNIEEEENHLGMRTDVLSGCLKTTGIMMLLRSMSPEIIAVDEIGSIEDRKALETAMHCGCGLLATIHGESIYDENMKQKLREYMEQGIFYRYIFLKKQMKPGKVNGIYTNDGQCIYAG